jgi:phosphatidylglycerol:prolipoprotein diacylglycerol transferase
MHPYLSFGRFTIESYWIMATIGLISGIFIFILRAKQFGISKWKVLIISLLSTLFALEISHISSLIFYYPSEMLKYPLWTLSFWKGGLTLYGGIGGGILALILFTKIFKVSFIKFLNASSPSIAFGLFIGRIGCFLNGCCYGKPTNLPWGVTFTYPNSNAPIGIPLHPTQIYESLTNFLIFIFLWSKQKNINFQRKSFLWFLVLYSVARFFIEFFRGDSLYIFSPYLRIAQIISLLIISSCIILFKIKKIS